MPSESIVIKTLKEKLAKINSRLAKVNDDIDHFTDPFPDAKDYITTVEYLRARQKHIDMHLHGKYSTGKMQKLYDEKLRLEIDRSEVINELFLKDKFYSRKGG